jgi:hypothetical protein
MMLRRIVVLCCALMVVPLLSLPASAHDAISGTVISVDPGTRTVVLEGGRTVRVAGDTQIVVDGRPVVVERLQPGSVVTIGTAPAGSAQSSARQTIRGVVTDVDRDGEVTIKTADGEEFDLRVAPATAALLKDGDAVVLDVSFLPGSQPSASPAMR